MRIGVAIDLGTSSYRAQKIDLESGKILKTVITLRNPLHGANVMDNLDFAIHYGLDKAHKLSVTAVKNIFIELGVKADEMEKLSICGNPIQLSIFQGIPIEDLAYAGERKKQKYHIKEQNREPRIISLIEIDGFEEAINCKLLVPPSIKHEVGADALVLIIKAGMTESNEISIATDYGTNAEMALIANGIIYTGSAAAGTYMDAPKAQHIGMIPYNTHYVSQIGNTSLAVAREILLSEERSGNCRQLLRKYWVPM